VLPGEGCYAEVNLDAARWIAEVARAVERGYVLTFDYGYEGPDLYAPWRRDGTLLCFYRQSASSDPYQRIGKQDMTASVDFTTLMREGEAAGLRTLGFVSQAEFLGRLGIGDAIAERPDPARLEAHHALRRAVIELVDMDGLGRVMVLLQGKGIQDRPPLGIPRWDSRG
jgi:SAM-dependent MidA family methyltransferase